MARLINTTSVQKLFCNITTVFEDGTESVKTITEGDIVNLRYVKDAKVVAVEGKVKGIDYTMPTRLNYQATAPADKLNDDITFTTIRLDASTAYNSNLITIPVKEIVEDAGVENVSRMKISASAKVTIKQEYSNGVIKTADLEVGDILDNVRIMTEPRKEDVIGKFTLVAFGYKSNRGKLAIDSLVLQDASGKNKAYQIAKFLTMNEIMQYEITSSDQLLLALSDPEATQYNITIAEDIQVDNTLVIEEGKQVQLDMGDSTLSVEIAETGGRSRYVLDNYGDTVITSGNFIGRGTENYGKLTIESGVTITAADSNGGACLWCESGSETIINGAELKTLYEGSTSDSSGPCNINVQEGGKVTVNDGNFYNNNRRAYSVINFGGDTVINNCVSFGRHGSLSCDGGTLTVYNGNFESEDFYAIYSSADSGKASLVKVYDGTFKGKTYSVWCGSDHGTSVETSIEIYGGTFLNPVKAQSNVREGYGIFLYGGAFNATPEQLEPYVAEGYVAVAEADGYTRVYKENEAPVVVPQEPDEEEPTTTITPSNPIEDPGEEIIDGDDPVDDEL